MPENKDKEEAVVIRAPIFEFSQQQTAKERAYDMAKISGSIPSNSSPKPKDGGDDTN